MVRKPHQLDTMRGLHDSVVRVYNVKVIVSGSCIEVVETGQPVFAGFKKNICLSRRDSPKDSDSEEELLKKEQKRLEDLEGSRRRAKNQFRRLVEANLTDRTVMLTLTYAENMQDRDVFLNDFDLFKRKVSRYIKKKYGLDKYVMDYVGVVEYQKRGALHVHLMVFNWYYIENKKELILGDLWSKGFVNVMTLEKINNAAAYMTKYMEKEFEENYKKKQKNYLNSKGLKKPMIYEGEKEKAQILATYPSLVKIHDSMYSSEYYDYVHYRQYRVKSQ